MGGPEDKLFSYSGEDRKRPRKRGERDGLIVRVRGNFVHVPDMKPLPGKWYRLGAAMVLLFCGMFWGVVLCLLWLT